MDQLGSRWLRVLTVLRSIHARELFRGGYSMYLFWEAGYVFGGSCGENVHVCLNNTLLCSFSLQLLANTENAS